MLDLIRKLALLKEEDCEPRPEVWYKARFGHDPDYSKLLEAISHSSTERQQLLRGYFEPTEEEREQGLKLPSPAHRAIAEMIRGGWIKVVVTTNFDRLLEQALEAVGGVQPNVISTPDAATGALPLIHSRCTILKVHGDYLDSRIKNTPKELATCSPKIKALLARIFDEFGLIIAGWSGEWDTALRASLERRSSRRFCVYWASRGPLKPIASKLSRNLGALEIQVKDADTFFVSVAEKVLALQDVSTSHPLSVKTAVATLERYLPEERFKIRMKVLVKAETDTAIQRLSVDSLTEANSSFSPQEAHRRIAVYEAKCEVLASMLATGAYWDNGRFTKLPAESIERIANLKGPGDRTPEWIFLRSYPSFFLTYAAGLAAIAGEKFEMLAALLTRPIRRVYNLRIPLVVEMGIHRPLMDYIVKDLPGMQNRNIPGSDYLHSRLRVHLQDLVPDDSRYDDCFDEFEYKLALVFADIAYESPGSGIRKEFLYDKLPHERFWCPVGRFVWRTPSSIIAHESKILQEAGEDHPLLQVGLFRSSLQRLQQIKAVVDQFISTRGCF
jgi:hypothetical protein